MVIPYNDAAAIISVIATNAKMWTARNRTSRDVARPPNSMGAPAVPI